MRQQGQCPRPGQGRHAGPEIGQPRPQVDMHSHFSRVDPTLMIDKSANAAAVVTSLKIRQKSIGSCLLPSDPAAAAAPPRQLPTARDRENFVSSCLQHRGFAPLHQRLACSEPPPLFRDWHRPLCATPDIERARPFSWAGNHCPASSALMMTRLLTTSISTKSSPLSAAALVKARVPA